MNSLTDDLASSDMATRSRAHRALVRQGSNAVYALTELLKSPYERIRWEAVRTLSEIHEPSATAALVTVLDDEVRDVRWLAADGLIARGEEAIKPVVLSLIGRPASVRVRLAAAHVLRAFLTGSYAEILRPVVAALGLTSPAVDVPVAAYDAIEKLRALQHEEKE
ncbi:MAG TPA: HEAT repeat domain-containing protein [Bacteroidota bacterium]|nr:HEAT repeat domain-containing protein [Bacteroidota bacterium]